MTATAGSTARCTGAASTWPRAARTCGARTRSRRRRRLPYVVRFHLHPLVAPTLQQDGETVVLRLASGGTWRFRAVGAAVSLEESIYLGGPQPRPSQQIVLTGRRKGRSS